jgi:purine nucleosidase/pyrimidine-specific ribonucleoside hydrolase
MRCVDAFVAIETEGRWTRGATVVDLHGTLGRPANARVAIELDVPRFWDLVLGAIQAL